MLTALAAVTAPLVNSYKRLIRGAPRSGATGALSLRYVRPRQPNADGPDSRAWTDRESHRGWRGESLSGMHRSAGCRLPDGIENKIDPGAINNDNLYEVSESGAEEAAHSISADNAA